MTQLCVSFLWIPTETVRLREVSWTVRWWHADPRKVRIGAVSLLDQWSYFGWDALFFERLESKSKSKRFVYQPP